MQVGERLLRRLPLLIGGLQLILARRQVVVGLPQFSHLRLELLLRLIARAAVAAATADFASSVCCSSVLHLLLSGVALLHDQVELRMLVRQLRLFGGPGPQRGLIDRLVVGLGGNQRRMRVVDRLVRGRQSGPASRCHWPQPLRSLASMFGP